VSILNEILTSVIALAQETNPYAVISIGALPADNGITMTYGAGSVDTTFFTKGMCLNLPVVLNGKHESQQTVSDTLNDIHASLTRRKTYPKTENYQITDISSISLPSYLDREERGGWLYGSSLRVKVFIF